MESEFSQQLKDQAYEIIAGNDSNLMETLFSHLVSSQEPNRSQSYLLLDCCKKHYPSILFLKLFYLLRYSPRVETRSCASTVLRFLRIGDLWNKLSLNAQVNLKAEFVNCLLNEESMPNVRILCSIVSDMACVVYKGNDQWRELTHFLVNSLELGEEKHRETALLVFVHLPKDCRFLVGQALIPRLESLHAGLLTALASTNIDVQVAAFSAMGSLAKLFSESPGRDWFLELLRAMMVGIFNLLTRSQENDAQKLINKLMDLVLEEPQILKPYLDYLVLDMLRIAENQVLTKEIRFCAIKFCIDLAEVKDLVSTMRELPNLTLFRLVTFPVKLLLYIEDDVAWYQMGSKDGENAGKTEFYNFGIECLNRFSIAIGEKKIVPIAFQLLPLFMDAQEWQKRYAGITMLAVIAKECSDEMVMTEDYIEHAMTKILRSFKDPHPRVCWAAFNFMQLPTDLVLVAQILHHPRIVPALAAALDENRNFRVKEQVVFAMFFFIKNIPPDLLIIHMDVENIMTKLLAFLQNIDNTVKGRSTALCVFNIVAQKCQEIAHKHCADYLPTLLEACDDKNSEIKQEATRAIRVCAEFGGPEFKPFIKKAIIKLGLVLGYPNRSYAEDLKAYDIAVSGLGKICEFHRDNIDAAKLLPTWLTLLPVKDDSIEAKIVHELLCSMVEKSDGDLLGTNNKFLPKIIAVFLEVITLGNDLATDQTISRMTYLLKNIWQNLPNAALNAIVSSLNTQHQELLRSIVLAS